MIRVTTTALEGVLLLEPEIRRDERGFFVETFREDALRESGIKERFVQESQSRSARSTLRGLHFRAPPGQAKLVRVARGRIFDVAVDLRRGSPTFGRHVATELDDETHRQIYLPPHMAHGFFVLSHQADVCYLVSRYYDPTAERGIAWDDPALAIEWPVSDPILSERDRKNPRLADLPPELMRW